MAKLTKIPEMFSAMTETELQDFLSHWNLDDVEDENGNTIPGMISRAVEWGVIDDLVALLDATSVKKRYPRMPKWDEEKKKTVYVADKSKPKVETVSPVGFFEVKAQFIHDIIGLPRIKEEPTVDFRTKIKAAAAAAKTNGKTRADYEAAADAKLAEIKAKAEKG